MNALAVALSLFAATPSPSAAILSPQFLVGKWQSEQAGTYHFRANGTYSWHGADEGWDGRWQLRGGNALELLTKMHGGKTRREIIVIDRVAHETLYVRTKYEREVWLKQPGP